MSCNLPPPRSIAFHFLPFQEPYSGDTDDDPSAQFAHPARQQMADQSTHAAYNLRQLYKEKLLPYEAWLADKSKPKEDDEEAAAVLLGLAPERQMDEACCPPKKRAKQAAAAKAAKKKEEEAEERIPDNIDSLLCESCMVRPIISIIAAGLPPCLPLSLPPCLCPSPECEADGARALTALCLVPQGGHHEDQIILCDNCDRGYHIFCLSPPLTEVRHECFLFL